MNTYPFKAGSTWAKLGYGLYSNSLEYRRVLEDNPVWDIDRLPPPGTILKSGSSTASNGPGASQLPPVFSANTTGGSSDWWPFDTYQEYSEAVSRYNINSIFSLLTVNGWSMDLLV